MSYRTDTKALVLAILESGPQHGYGIARAVKEKSEGILKLGEGQLYPILHELEERGLILGDWEMQDGDPPRKVYSLTPSGQGELSERAERWEAYIHAVGRVLKGSQEAADGAI